MIDEKLRRAIQNFDLESYVRATFDRVVPSGSSELRVDCFAPKGCAGSDSHAHLWINIHKRAWICYKCGYGDPDVQKGTSFLPRFISDAERIPFPQAVDRIVKSSEVTPDFEDLELALEKMFEHEEGTEEEEEIKPLRQIDLPKQFYQLSPATGRASQSFKSYAAKRGFPHDQQALYDVRYCISRLPSLPERYQNTFVKRIIFPIYDQQGICRSAVARDAGASWERPKWVNWPDTDLAHFFWPLGRWVGGIFHPNSMGLGRVVLTEGIIDAHAIREMTSRISFACFGKKLSDSQIDLLHENRVTEIMLAWDRDAKSKMIKMAEKLSGRFIVKVFPYQHEAWDRLDLDLGDTLDPKCPMHSHELMEKEIKSAIDVQSGEFCRWVAS
jgi:hypothetical protein